jgi:dihydrofolate reductase
MIPTGPAGLRFDATREDRAMTKVKFDISMSLDGYVAGPNPSVEDPLGEGGERLHEWAFGLASWRESHGESGGETGTVDDLVRESLAANGAVIMGRNMFGGGKGPWGDDPWQGWWGEEPPFGMPVFVLTHHEREPLVKGETTFTFATDGIGPALEQAAAAAGDKYVQVSGGADVGQQYLRAGLLDELHLHVAPVLLGGGTRLFDGGGPGLPTLEPTRVIDSPAATHIIYRVMN